jgi:hypothetical protein
MHQPHLVVSWQFRQPDASQWHLYLLGSNTLTFFDTLSVSIFLSYINILYMQPFPYYFTSIPSHRDSILISGSNCTVSQIILLRYCVASSLIHLHWLFDFWNHRSGHLILTIRYNCTVAHWYIWRIFLSSQFFDPSFSPRLQFGFSNLNQWSVLSMAAVW